MRFHHPAVPIVLTILLIDSIGFGIVLPVLPGLIVHLGQVSLAEATRIAGYMLIAYAVAQFFAGPLLGNLGDRFGRRPVLLFCAIAFGLDYLLMAAAPSLAWLFVGRLVAGAAGATYGPANAVLADVTPPEKRGATFGLMGAAFGLGFILGPAIGGLLAGLGTRAPFIAAAALAGANAVWIATRLPETLPAERRRPFRLRDAHVFAAFRPLFHAGGATRRSSLPPCSGSSAILFIPRPGRSGPSSRFTGTRPRSAGRWPPRVSPWRSPRPSSPAARSPASARRARW